MIDVFPTQFNIWQSGDGDSNNWDSPPLDSASAALPADGVVDNSGDLLPTVYRDDPSRPDALGFSLPSHADLEENYKTETETEVTAGAKHSPVAVVKPPRT